MDNKHIDITLLSKYYYLIVDKNWIIVQVLPENFNWLVEDTFYSDLNFKNANYWDIFIVYKNDKNVGVVTVFYHAVDNTNNHNDNIHIIDCKKKLLDAYNNLLKDKIEYIYINIYATKNILQYKVDISPKLTYQYLIKTIYDREEKDEK